VSEISVSQIQVFWAVILCSRRTTSWYLRNMSPLHSSDEEFFF